MAIFLIASILYSCYKAEGTYKGINEFTEYDCDVICPDCGQPETYDGCMNPDCAGQKC